jgi:hypothetical protein
MDKVFGVGVEANDVQFHFPAAMFQPSDLGITAYQIALPIEVFDDECFKMRHALWKKHIDCLRRIAPQAQSGASNQLSMR